MIDLETETPLTFAHAAKLRPLGRNGRPPALSTVWRWATAGCRGVRLETVRVGGTLCTSEQAVGRFLAALNARPGAAAALSPLNRSRAIAAAERELDAAGVAIAPPQHAPV